MLITKTIEIDTGHRVHNHRGKCKTPHGHRYIIEVGVDDKVITTSGLSDEGMVIDYGDLKNIMIDVLDAPFDHTGVYYVNDPKKASIIDFYEGCPKEPVFVDFVPTAENLACYWYTCIKERLTSLGLKLEHVKVWETPNSTAIFTSKDK